MSGQTPIDPLDATYPERLACAQARAEQALVTTTHAVAGELSVKEVADILDVTTQTVGRWIRNGFTARATPLWTQAAWTRTPTGAWTIPLAELRHEALTEIQQDRLLVTQLRRSHSSSPRNLAA